MRSRLPQQVACFERQTTLASLAEALNLLPVLPVLLLYK
jgi:hypothetical protein